MISAPDLAGEFGGALAMAFASGAVASFGYSWAFFVLPTRKLMETAFKKLDDAEERYNKREKESEDGCKERIKEVEERYNREITRLSDRVRELEHLFTIGSIGQVRQQTQIVESSRAVADRIQHPAEKKYGE